MAVERVDPPFQGDERAVLSGFLDYQRATLEWKCSGVADADLRRRMVEPSSLSLLGLVRHMADVERSWFHRVFLDDDAPPLFYSADNRDGEFDDVDDCSVEEAFETWRAECAHSRAVVAAAPSMDSLAAHAFEDGTQPSLRWIMAHMIEEYARHNGHADLLRERIDGAVGE